MNYKKFLFFLSLNFIFLCVSQKPGVYKKDYNFNKIKIILVLSFSAPEGYSNVGDIISDVFVQKLLEKGYEVYGREIVKGESDFEKIKEIAKSKNIDVIISGSIYKYSVEKKISLLPKKEKEFFYSNNTNTKISIKEGEKEIIVSEGRVYGFDAGLPYEIEATFGVICKMIDVNTSEVIWSSKKETTAFSIDDAIETGIKSIIKSMPEPINN